MNKWATAVYVCGAIVAGISACKNATDSGAAAPRPTLSDAPTGPTGPTTTTTVNTTPVGTNTPPLVGALNPMVLMPGGTFTGTLQASEPDAGDVITRIEFVTEPVVTGFSGITIPVGTGDQHPFSISVPSSPGIPGSMGHFVVYDSRGASSRASFPLTFNLSGSGSVLAGASGSLQALCTQLAANYTSDNTYVNIGTQLAAAFGCSMLGKQ
jgi:hypothetical protein